MIWKSKRTKDLERLCSEQSALIKQLNDKRVVYSIIHAPDNGDLLEFNRCIADLTSNNFYLFYLSQKRREIVDEFEARGKENAEYYRGMLKSIGDIMQDSTNAAKQLQGNLQNEV
jgi:hypothetical protein